MTHIARRNFLLAGAAVPLALEAGGNQSSGRAAEAEPGRFEAIPGYRLADAVDSSPLALIPCGSLEYHGPHNPLGADTIIISGLAERVALRTRAALFPTICFTHCPAHTARFKGTLSIRPEVMTLYFEDVLRAILSAGFNRILMLNGATTATSARPGARSPGRRPSVMMPPFW